MTADISADAITPITICAIMELSSGIIAACIPACMPIFQWRKNKARRATYGYTISNQIGAVKPKTRSDISQGGEVWETEDGHDTVPLKPMQVRRTITTEITVENGRK